jgi:hypothetical protein
MYIELTIVTDALLEDPYSCLMFKEQQQRRHCHFHFSFFFYSGLN